MTARVMHLKVVRSTSPGEKEELDVTGAAGVQTLRSFSPFKRVPPHILTRLKGVKLGARLIGEA
jgi:hypothetical protein